MRRGPSYRVQDKIFALERPWRDSIGLWCKVPEGSREIIIGSDPARFFIPPYFGAKGWIGVEYDVPRAKRDLAPEGEPGVPGPFEREDFVRDAVRRPAAHELLMRFGKREADLA